MDQRGQAERGDKQVFAPFVINDRWVDMTTGVARYSILRPTPLLECSRVKLQLARGSGKALTCFIIDHHTDSRPITNNFTTMFVNLCAFQLNMFQFALIEREDGRKLARNFKGAIFLHVLQRCQVFSGCRCWQAWHTIFKDPAVVFFNAKFFAGAIGRPEVFTNTQASIGVDAPGQLYPEFILFPYLARVDLISILHRLSMPLLIDAQYRLAIANPASCMGLLAHQVVPFTAHSHRQYIVRVPCRLTPDRSQGRV